MHTARFELQLQKYAVDEFEKAKFFAGLENLSKLDYHTIILLRKIRIKGKIFIKSKVFWKKIRDVFNIVNLSKK